MISSSDALLILKGWRDERTVLGCETELFANWAVRMRCLVESVSDDGEVRLMTPGSTAILGLAVPSCDGIEYGEAKPPRDAVMIFVLPLRPGELATKRDKIVLTVLRPED